MIEIKPATKKTLEDYYQEPVMETTKAVVAVEDGKVIAVGGIKLQEDTWVAFLSTTVSPKENKRALAKGIRAFKQILISLNRSVYACPDMTKEGAEILLEHIGFEKRRGYYEWKRQH